MSGIGPLATPAVVMFLVALWGLGKALDRRDRRTALVPARVARAPTGAAVRRSTPGSPTPGVRLVDPTVARARVVHPSATSAVGDPAA